MEPNGPNGQSPPSRPVTHRSDLTLAIKPVAIYRTSATVETNTPQFSSAAANGNSLTDYFMTKGKIDLQLPARTTITAYGLLAFKPKVGAGSRPNKKQKRQPGRGESDEFEGTCERVTVAFR